MGTGGMQVKHWRELVELVGVISIVAALLLLAWEVRQTNRLATLTYKAELQASFDAVHSARLTNTDVARLYPKLAAPGSHLITATETSQIRGLAIGLMQQLQNVQSAYEQSLLNQKELQSYKLRFAQQIESLPGLVPHLLEIYDRSPDLAEAELFSPIAAHRDTEDPSGKTAD